MSLLPLFLATSSPRSFFSFFIIKKNIIKLKEFASRVHNHKKELVKLLYNIKYEGKRIVCISAPAKGMTLLNFCNIDNSVCDYVTEKSKLKIGRE